ncbi:MAG: PLP-dependent aminotransferase family protein [Chitinispirillaceae bacterium]|nr:PLP-dependent aminotransferase family protein [Chitinispirillaceae bacterium]
MVDFSVNAKGMRSSEIRHLMKLAANPSIISFAGGMPGNELFPVDVLDELYNGLSRNAKQVALQYGPTPGYPPLLDSLKSYLQSRGLPFEKQGLIITTGAQQAINLMTKVLIDPGDLIVTEYPSFIGAVAAFKSYGANLTSIELDSDGIDIDKLEKTIDGRASQIKMLYLSPHFHNPAGIIYSEERKRALIKLLSGRPFCLLEDDPYGELYFDEADKPLTVPIKACAGESLPVCYVGTFAKIFGPGLRLGWLLAPQPVIEKCELAKQSMDACSPTFTQVLAHEYLSRGKLAPYVAWVRPIYARRAKLMLDALGETMPDGVSWTTPKGGFYVWVTLPPTIDSTEVLSRSMAEGAAFVIGSAFDPHGVRNNTFRLAFSYTPEEKIEKGIAIIADAIKALM